MYIYVYIHIYVYMCVCVFVCVCESMVYMCVCVRVCLCLCLGVSACVSCIYILFLMNTVGVAPPGWCCRGGPSGSRRLAHSRPGSSRRSFSILQFFFRTGTG